MSSVGVNPPKTPVTEGSSDVAPATLPNVCKMPGPPAPFVPVPLPNIGKSSDRLSEATSTVRFEGNKVAIKGSYYMSQPSPDVASQGTGGGIVSSTVQGKTEFVAPGSMTVKAEGKNIQLLGDAMTNNGGSPANSSTVPGNQQAPSGVGIIYLECSPGWNDCQKKQMKAKAAKLDSIAKQGKVSSRNTYQGGKPTLARKNGNGWAAKYARDWNNPSPKGWPDASNPARQPGQFYDDCAQTGDPKGAKMEADHIHEMQLGGRAHGPFLWLDGAVNGASGRQIKEQRVTIPNPTGFEAKNC
jgi:uncharacterized Zn-binding protein involved in type VI secretion